MRTLDRVLDLLPPPYSIAADALAPRFLEGLTNELDIFQEDLDRMQRTHWVNFAFRMDDLTKLAALAGVVPIPGESLRAFRVRLLGLVAAKLAGAVGPAEIKRFVRDYLVGAEEALDSTFVPGLAGRTVDQAFAHDAEHPAYRPLELREYPSRQRRSRSLAELGGKVPYLFRWQERNRGLEEATVRFAVTGLSEGRTAVPLLVNVTTGDLIGYQGVLGVGRRLVIEAEPGSRLARATMDDRDVTDRIFSVSGFELGVPFDPPDRDAAPRVPRLARGVNELIFLSVGLYDVRGLDHIFYAIADATLYEGVFDTTFFDHAVLPSGMVAMVEMEWTELEPASFEAHVPRFVVVAAPEVNGGRVHELVAAALQATVREVHTAGVRAEVVFEPFRETQEQRGRARVPWVVVPPETGPSGEGEEIELGARYGESGLDRARFE